MPSSPRSSNDYADRWYPPSGTGRDARRILPAATLPNRMEAAVSCRRLRCPCSRTFRSWTASTSKRWQPEKSGSVSADAYCTATCRRVGYDVYLCLGDTFHHTCAGSLSPSGSYAPSARASGRRSRVGRTAKLNLLKLLIIPVVGGFTVQEGVAPLRRMGVIARRRNRGSTSLTGIDVVYTLSTQRNEIYSL